MRSATVRISQILHDAYDHLSHGRYPQSADLLKQVLKRQPQNWDALWLVGLMAAYRGHFDIAEQHFRKALMARQKYQSGVVWPECLNALSTALLRLDRGDEAIPLIDEALKAAPTSLDLWIGRANLYADNGDDDAALRCLEEAGKYHPSSPHTRWTRSFIQLKRGQYLEGWANYECRWDNREWAMHHRRDFHTTRPQWFGRPFPDKTLLVHWEQGFGDTIMFARYLPWCKSLGGNVMLECQAALKPLMVGVVGADLVIGHGEPLPPFDLWISTMSLPMVHRTTLETIPEPARLAA